MIHSVPVGRASDIAATTVLSRWRGDLRVTAICKATFGFAYDGEMALAPPVDIARGDVHAAKNPMRSVRVSSDVSPHLERVDVMFVGRAHAPSGTKVERMSVRLAIADDVVPVLDKRLSIVGERATSTSPPTPFDVMPIVYERAVGGLGFPDNPLGVGIGAAAASDPQPNVLHLDAARAQQVAGFGPRSATWPVRKKLLRGRPRPSVEGIAELPDDVDWIYFQSAPPDQWLDQLPSRAWVVLEGLNPRNALLHMRLPPMRAMARLHGPSVGAPFELKPDTLFIDGEAEHCTVTWRGSLSVASAEALEGAWMAVALEMPARPLAWPAAPLQAESVEVVSSSKPAGTVIIDDGPVRPPAAPAPKPPGHAPTGTMIVDGDAMAAAAVAGTSPSKFSGTMIVEEPPPFVAPLPFAGGRIPMRRDPPPPLPGAPWAGGPAAPATAPRPDLGDDLPAATMSPETLLLAQKQRAEKTRREDLALSEEKRRAEVARQAEEAQRLEATRLAQEREARERREVEREEEARAAAERFAKEQAAARKTEAERLAAEAAERTKAIKDLKKKAYGGFDD